jgi:hypothetical protein
MKDYKLGVLFVHGIGTQPARETLVRWGDVLLNVIARATATPGKVIPIVGRASGGDRSGDNPAEVPVDIHCGDQTEKWLLAEGWWAGSFPAPTYSELVSWCVRAVPWSFALHIAQRYWQTDPGASRSAKLIAYTTAILQLISAMAFAPVFITLLALALLLGLLPIPQLRSLIISTQTALIGTIGESLAFVESPLRAAFILGRRLAGAIARMSGAYQSGMRPCSGCARAARSASSSSTSPYPKAGRPSWRVSWGRVVLRPGGGHGDGGGVLRNEGRTLCAHSARALGLG